VASPRSGGSGEGGGGGGGGGVWGWGGGRGKSKRGRGGGGGWGGEVSGAVREGERRVARACYEDQSLYYETHYFEGLTGGCRRSVEWDGTSGGRSPDGPAHTLSRGPKDLINWRFFFEKAGLMKIPSDCVRVGWIECTELRFEGGWLNRSVYGALARLSFSRTVAGCRGGRLGGGGADFGGCSLRARGAGGGRLLVCHLRPDRRGRRDRLGGARTTSSSVHSLPSKDPKGGRGKRGVRRVEERRTSFSRFGEVMLGRSGWCRDSAIRRAGVPGGVGVPDRRSVRKVREGVDGPLSLFREGSLGGLARRN